MAKILGIDLGTTNSAMAVMEGSEPEILVNAEGDRTTPSVEGFRKDGERVVGKAAKNQAVTNPENTVSSVKRFIGRSFNETSDEQKTVSYKVQKGKDGRAVVDIDGKDYTPEEISAMVLQKLKADAEKQLGGPGDAGRHHGPGLLQRRTAPGHQGRRQDRGPRSAPHHQRAHSGGACLRLGQNEQGREDPGVRPGRRHVRRVHPGTGRRRVRGRIHRRRQPPGRRRLGPAHHRLARRQVPGRQRHRPAPGQDGPAGA